MTGPEKDISAHAAPRDHAYLYLGSVSEARRYNELDKWRASHEQNIACKQAIEDAGIWGKNLNIQVIDGAVVITADEDTDADA